MRRPFSRFVSDDDANLDLTPMLDVVFILLIFFIVTASFVKESGIDVNRPQASTANRKELATIFVGISATNEIWINKRRVDQRAITGLLQRLHAENPQGAVVIQADSASTNERLVQVMDAARQAGIFNISIATELP
jgi:biopolymer transport protein ExbD